MGDGYGLGKASLGYGLARMALIVVTITVLGPFLLALGLFSLTRRCERWLGDDPLASAGLTGAARGDVDLAAVAAQDGALA